MMTEDFELVSVDGIFSGFRSLHQAFSDKVVKLHLTHFVCTTDGVRRLQQILVAVLFKLIPEVFDHSDH